MTCSSADATVNTTATQRAGMFIKTLRPRQWTKNLIVFAPAIFALKLHEPRAVLAAFLCFVAFCLVSGSVYIFNDVLDAEADRKHPVKCKRPIPSGAIGVPVAITFGIIVCLLGLALGALARPAVTLILISYILLQLLYAFSLKHQPLIDVGCIAAGFVLRAVSGAVAVHVPISGWFLLCTGLASLFLALEKRRQELKVLGDSATGHRAALGGYSVELLNRLEAMILPALLLSYTLYTFLSWHGQWMMLTVPFILYGTGRYLKISTDSHITATPEEVLLKDVPIQVTLLLWTVTSILVVYKVLPHAWVAAVQYVDKLAF